MRSADADEGGGEVLVASFLRKGLVARAAAPGGEAALPPRGGARRC